MIPTITTSAIIPMIIVPIEVPKLIILHRHDDDSI